MVKLYRRGVPRFAGYHSSGAPLGTVKLVWRNVDALVLAGSGDTGKGPELTSSSGIVMVIVGAPHAPIERTARVTLTTQSAAWSARLIDVWPTLEISKELSSMNTLPVDASKGCEAGVVTFVALFDVRVTRYAGLKIPLGTNAGPYSMLQPRCD